MKDITLNEKEIDYILKGLYSMLQSYGGGYHYMNIIFDIKTINNVRAIVNKLLDAKEGNQNEKI
mgnify:CR=1 FL=1